MATNYDIDFTPYEQEDNGNSPFTWWDIISGRAYNTDTARNKIPFVNNWTAALLVTGSQLLANKVPDETYDLYKQQEQAIIDAALNNAEMVKAQGEVELRNLRIKHDMAMGTDIIKVSGSGGNMSGSFLDALMQQRKYQMLDEKSVITNTVNQATAIMKEGYNNAMSVAIQAQNTAVKEKYGVYSALLAGFGTYVQSALKDKTEAARQDANNETLDRTKQNREDKRNSGYGVNSPTYNTGTGDATSGVDILDQIKREQVNQASLLNKYKMSKRGVLGNFDQDLGSNTIYTNIFDTSSSMIG